jgi:hypothetical protein
MPVKIIALIIVTAIMMVLLLIGEAHSQQTCTSRKAVLGLIQSPRYKEQLSGRGISLADGTLMELYLSEDGTFSILKSWPNGMTCLSHSGTDWQSEEIKKGAGL